jgi:predicted dehydrogenase
MTLRTAVIGVGSMGRNHARVYSELDAAELVGVADVNLDAAEGIARRFGGRAFADYRQMLEAVRPQAVTVAVPTQEHCAVALDVLARSIHVLVEKPLAYTCEEGARIIAAAEAAGVQLMVGHVERFNPAVIALKERLASDALGRIFQIDARRQGPFPARVRDVGVVVDLAVHDLDIIRYVTGHEVVRVYAETERRIHSTYEDLLNGTMRLDDGAVATLTTNWLTPTKIRTLDVVGEQGMFRVDYITQDLYFYDNATAHGGEWEALRMLRGVSEGSMTRYAINKQEPLRSELQAFVTAVEQGDPAPVSGRDGLRAIELAQALVRSGQEHQVVAV